MFARNCWYVAGWAQEFEGAALHARQMLGEPILIYRKETGVLVALEDRCRHRLAPLSRGRREGDAVRCMYHGMKFDADGRCIEIPGQATIPDIACVRRYPLVERGGWVWLWPGDPGEADETLVPPVIGLDDPAYVSGIGALDYETGFKLINDNLLDFSHLSFVHENSFGDSRVFADTRPTVSRLERGVRIARWIPADPDRPPAPTQAAQGVITPVDQWQCYDYLVPGVMILHSEVWAAGSSARWHGRAPEGEPLSETISCQAVTPIAERRTRYYFTAGARNAPGAEAARDRVLRITLDAFAEDRAMIEAQQAIIDADPARTIMPTTVDRAAILFDRLMARIG